MKKYISGVILFLLLINTTSCKKYLETKPLDFVAPENYFETAQQTNSYLNSVYDVMNRSAGDFGFYSGNYQVSIAQGTDESFNRTNLNNTKPYHYNATPADLHIEGLWSLIYTGIDRANVLLENINKPKDLIAINKKHMIAEAKFLRAYYHFIATQWWGDVPLRTKSTSKPEDTNIAFTPQSDVYNWIIKEMEEAEPMLEDQQATDISPYNSGRIVQTTLDGILARVCLYAAGKPVNQTSRYADALKWANKAIQSGIHNLNPDYEQIFINHSADLYDVENKESMWEAEFSLLPGNSGLREGMSTTMIGINDGANPNGQTKGQIFATAILYRSYQSFYNPINQTDNSPDLRRDLNLSTFEYKGGTLTSASFRRPYGWNQNGWWLRWPGKWKREFETKVPRDNNLSPQNWPLLRFADILLMKAEAENEINGPSAAAVDAVNQVRRRAYGELKNSGKSIKIIVTNSGTGYTSVPTVTISGGGGTGATANARLVNGSIDILTGDLGSGYTSVPTVTINGGGGTGVTAEAVLISADLESSAYSDKDVFRTTIKNERMRELCYEGFRRQDLIRWGQLVEKVKERADLAKNGSLETFYDNKQIIPPVPSGSNRTNATFDGENISVKWIYLPIPNSELSNNNLAKQNSGF